ncbi:MAG: hypothetical protein SFW36_19115 [Leptolyngbyaceae cyanobacterium bins.59]|nr:hypothetical protein [Leptolyngbyaceae cyanobacterium bins.59]
MHKSLEIALTAIAFSISSIVSVGHHSTALAGAREHNTPIDTPLCYVQQSDGKIQDLSALCGFISPEICSVLTEDASRTEILTRFCQENPKCLLSGTCEQIPTPVVPVDPNTPLG